MITDLPTKRITVTNISHSFTYKMATEINWHRHGTKLRHCHPTMYISCIVSLSRTTVVSYIVGAVLISG